MTSSPHDDMRTHRYTLTSETALGVPGFAAAVERAVYRPDVLIPQPDTEGPVPDRYRVKDMVHYLRGEGGSLSLTPTSAARFARLGTPPNTRPAPWFHWLDIPGAGDMTCALLNLVPPEWRHAAGTFGVHAIRSFTDVVSGPHQDGFEYGVTYVLNRTTGGAESYLIRDGHQVLARQLQPGEILLFHDGSFLHGATALDEGGYRDALIIQFDAPEDLAAAAEERAGG